MDDRLRILPMVALGALVLLTVKGLNIWTGIQSDPFAISQAHAGGAAPAKSDDAQKNGAQKNGTKKDGAKDKGAEKDKQEAETEVPDYSIEYTPGLGEADFGAVRDPALISESEVRVLESLAERRAQLEQREKQLAMKTSLLEAAEKRVAKRIEELRAVEGRVKTLLGQYDEAQEVQISSLVKVYENMKAKDAARIFENLESDILIAVAGRMREVKIAAILASMSPAKAQALTVMMANRFASDQETEMAAEKAREG